jgi:hypothetical protein
MKVSGGRRIDEFRHTGVRRTCTADRRDLARAGGLRAQAPKSRLRHTGTGGLPGHGGNRLLAVRVLSSRPWETSHGVFVELDIHDDTRRSARVTPLLAGVCRSTRRAHAPHGARARYRDCSPYWCDMDRPTSPHVPCGRRAVHGTHPDGQRRLRPDWTGRCPLPVRAHVRVGVLPPGSPVSVRDNISDPGADCRHGSRVAGSWIRP